MTEKVRIQLLRHRWYGGTEARSETNNKYQRNENGTIENTNKSNQKHKIKRKTVKLTSYEDRSNTDKEEITLKV